MRFSLDTNVLFYSFRSGTDRSRTADRILFAALGLDCVLTNQALGEFMNAVRAKLPERVAPAREVVSGWSLVFQVAPTSTDQLIQASALAERHRLQFWDSLMIVVAGAAGAEWLLTEEMHDGATYAGVRLLNPFNAANAEALDLLLTPEP